MRESNRRRSPQFYKLRLGLGIVILGFFVFILGVRPSLFGVDRSPIVGFVQIAVFLMGLAFISLGGIITMNALWDGREKSIPADIGYRLVSTGYVIAVASGMADVFGFGTQIAPDIPYFGPWQALGVMVSEVVIAIGLLMMIPFPARKKHFE